MKNTRRTHLADAMTNTEGPTLWYDVVYRTQIHSVYEVLKLMQSSSPVKIYILQLLHMSIYDHEST